MSLAMESNWVFCPKQEGVGDSGGPGMEMYLITNEGYCIGGLYIFRIKKDNFLILH